MACTQHPSRATAVTLYGRDYCTTCDTEIQAAVARLDAHVTPPECFVWYENARVRWQPIPGTGCAHYVSHQLGIRTGSANECCLDGYTFRVPVMLLSRTAVTGGITAVQVGHIWASTARDHTGVVSRIDPPPAGSNAAPIVWITHASSNQQQVATNRYDTYFHGRGDFFR